MSDVKVTERPTSANAAPRSTSDAFALARASVADWLAKHDAAPAEIGARFRAVVATALMQGVALGARDMDRIGDELARRTTRAA